MATIVYQFKCDACGDGASGEHRTITAVTRRADGHEVARDGFDVCTPCYAAVIRLMRNVTDWTPVKASQLGRVQRADLHAE